MIKLFSTFNVKYYLVRGGRVTIKSWEEFVSAEDSSEQGKLSTKLNCFPAMSNFNGKKYSLSCINHLQSKTSFVLLDAASFVSTNYLDLTTFTPDFVTLSFYKMFGYPTGLGALLIRNKSANILNKHYFGGGTVDLALVRKNLHFSRKSISQMFEDGTIDYLGKTFDYFKRFQHLIFTFQGIISLISGFETLHKVPGGIKSISLQTFNLANYAFHQLSQLKHFNDSSVVRFYCEEDAYERVDCYGGVVNFNLLTSEGSYIGFSALKVLCQMNNIILR